MHIHQRVPRRPGAAQCRCHRWVRCLFLRDRAYCHLFSFHCFFSSHIRTHTAFIRVRRPYVHLVPPRPLCLFDAHMPAAARLALRPCERNTCLEEDCSTRHLLHQSPRRHLAAVGTGHMQGALPSASKSVAAANRFARPMPDSCFRWFFFLLRFCTAKSLSMACFGVVQHFRAQRGVLAGAQAGQS